MSSNVCDIHDFKNRLNQLVWGDSPQEKISPLIHPHRNFNGKQCFIPFRSIFSCLIHHFPIFLFTGSLQIVNSSEVDQGKYECVAENSVGTEHSKATSLYVKVRRVPPTFSRPPEPLNEVMLGANLNLSCVAVGSPMPHVKWMKGRFLHDIWLGFHT